MEASGPCAIASTSPKLNRETGMTTFAHCPRCCCNELGRKVIRCHGCGLIFCETCSDAPPHPCPKCDDSYMDETYEDAGQFSILGQVAKV